MSKCDHTDFKKVYFEDASKCIVKKTEVKDIFVSEESSLLRLCDSKIQLRDVCFISKGMVLNSDEITASGQFTKKDLISDTKDKIHNKRYTEGKWIEQYRILKIKFLEWNTDRVPDKISRPTFNELYKSEKILTNKIGRLKAVYDDSEIVCDQTNRILVRWIDLKNVSNNSINNSIKRYTDKNRDELEAISMNFDLKYILALINSKLFANLFNSLRTKESFDINPEILKKLPMIQIKKAQQDEYIELVNEILELTKSVDYPQNLSKQVHVKELENQIDQMVYKLYGLTEEEIKIVEEQTSVNVATKPILESTPYKELTKQLTTP